MSILIFFYIFELKNESLHLSTYKRIVEMVFGIHI